MEKKLTNSGPFIQSTRKHSIYTLGVSRWRRPWRCPKCATDWACSCWQSTAHSASTPSVAKGSVNYSATSRRDSTIIAPVSVCHHGSYAETYS